MTTKKKEAESNQPQAEARGKFKQTSGTPATEVWAQIDSTVINVAGKRVFYQLTDSEGGSDAPGGRKSIALVRNGLTGERDILGRQINLIEVFPCVDRASFKTKAPLSSGREPGTFDLAKDGDLVN